MYLSMGNVTTNPEIGCLFIDFERPFRMRLQGRAEVLRDDPLFDLWKEPELVVKVVVSETWMNCPRYVHRYEKKSGSRYMPREKSETPLCEWKRIDAVQDTLRPHKNAAVKRAGQITAEEWMGRVFSGDEEV